MFGLDAWLNSEADYIRFSEGPEPEREYSAEEENRDREDEGEE